MSVVKNWIRQIIALSITCSALATTVEASDVTWTLNTPDGTEVTFPYAHQEPVALLFWASWCPYCKALMPELQAVADEYQSATGQSLTVYAINFRDDGDPQAYIDENDLDFVVLPNGDEVAEQYGIYGTPGLLLFDADNNVVLNLYELAAEINARLTGEEGLSNREKAALKAPLWADGIRAALGLEPMALAETTR